MERERHYFTFGQDHMTNYPLPLGGRIADYWVTVDLPKDSDHRGAFMEHFTSQHCPTRTQFAFEYGEHNLKPHYFLYGELCVINEEGIVK